MENLEFEKKIDRASSWLHHHTFSRTFRSTVYYIHVYSRTMPVRIICSDPNLSRLRISLLVARHGICKDRRYRI